MKLETLPVLILHPYSRCNCRCAMCDIWKNTAAIELSEEGLAAQLDSIRKLGVQWVVLSGGEPLMHPDLWRLCAMLRDLDVRITLLSSGLLLERYARQIVDHLDDVIVSLDGPAEIHDSIRGVRGAFDLLAAGVRRIRLLRPDFRIAARCTVQRSNCRCLRATAAAAQAIHLDAISFLAADLESTAFNRPEGWPEARQEEIALDAAAAAALEMEIEALIAAEKCPGFVQETPEKLRRIARHFRVHLKEAAPVAPVCNAPWTSAVVEADGSVRPCFFHAPIGNLRSGLRLDQIVNSPEAIAFRQSLDVATNPVCQRCVCSLNWTGSRARSREVSIENGPARAAAS